MILTTLGPPVVKVTNMGEVDYHHLLTSSGWHCFDDYRNVYAEDGTLVYDAPFEFNLDESVPSFYIHGVPYWLNPEGLLSPDADDYFHTSSDWYFFDDYYNVYLEDGTLVHDGSPNAEMGGLLSPTFYIDGASYWFALDVLWYQASIDTVYRVHTWQSQPGNNPNSLYCFSASDQFYYLDTRRNLYSKVGKLLYDGSSSMLTNKLHKPNFHIGNTPYWLHKDGLLSRSADDTMCRVLAWVEDLYSFHTPNGLHHFDRHQNVYSDKGIRLHNRSHYAKSDGVTPLIFQVDSDSYWFDLGRANVSEEGKQDDGVHAMTASFGNFNIDSAQEYEGGARPEPVGEKSVPPIKPSIDKKGCISRENVKESAHRKPASSLVPRQGAECVSRSPSSASDNGNSSPRTKNGLKSSPPEKDQLKVSSTTCRPQGPQPSKRQPTTPKQDREPAADVKSGNDGIAAAQPGANSSQESSDHPTPKATPSALPKAEQDEQDDTEVSYSFHTPNGLRYFDRHRNVYSDKGIRVHMGDLWCQVSTNIYRVHTWKSELNRHSPDKKYCFFTSGHFYYLDDHRDVYSEDGKLFYNGSSSSLTDKLHKPNFHIAGAPYWLHKDGLLSRSADDTIFRVVAWVQDLCSLNDNPDPLENGFQWGLVPFSPDPSSSSKSPNIIEST
ncbi:unnamed protein product, partial [Rhizoctonia solani]